MKKLRYFVLAIALLCALTALSASAAESLSGTFGEALAWSLDTSTGTLTISGSGDMPDFDFWENFSPWYDHSSSITNVIINEGVTSIGNCAFYDCGNITSLELPSGITRIGESAFYQCEKIPAVTIPDGVTSIESNAFLFCSNLAEVSIPNSVASIGVDAYAYCMLTNVTLPASVTAIQGNPFRCCTKLLNIHVAEENPSYCDSNGVLFDKKMEHLICYPAGRTDGEYTFPDGLTSIGESAFESCKLTHLTIPNTVTEIGASAFRNTPWLNSFEEDFCIANGLLFAYRGKGGDVVIPDGVISIEDGVFTFNSTVTSIVFPNSVAKIGRKAFDSCQNLTHVTFGSGLNTIGDMAFDVCTKITDITIPSSVVEIGSRAFYQCEGLTELTIPGNVKTVGSYAFAYCNNLSMLTIERGVISLGGHAFEGCKQVKNVLIPKSVTYMGEEIFRYSGLTNVTILGNITSIGARSFELCFDLTSVMIPVSVVNIGEGAFPYRNANGEVFYTGSEEQWKAIEIGEWNHFLTGATMHFNYLPPVAVSGTLGDSQELSWAYTNAEGGVLTFNTPIPEKQAVFAAILDESGKFSGVKCITADSQSAQVGTDFGTLRLFWLDDSFTPQGASGAIEL